MKTENVKENSAKNTAIGIQNTVGFSLFVCRLVGLYPVEGLISGKIRKLRFKIKSLYITIYSFTWLTQLLFATMAVYRICRNGPSSTTITQALLPVNGFATIIFLFISARVWPNFAKEVAKIEKALPPIVNKGLKIKSRAMALSLLSLSIIEVIFMMLMNMKQISTCSEKQIFSELYFKKFTPIIFDYTPYALWKGICTTVIFTQFVIASNLTDVIVMIVSMYLTTYFRSFREHFSTLMGKSQSEWEVVRGQHSRLLRLVRLCDDHFSGLVLLAFGKNLGYMCIQLRGLFRKIELHKREGCDESMEKALTIFKMGWFLFSFLFLMVRSGSVAFLTARLNTVAQRIPLAVYEMPDVTYYKEARRLVAQMNSCTVALSGFQYFYVTRASILSMIGTLITYELVLLQFSAPDGTKSHVVMSFNNNTLKN